MNIIAKMINKIANQYCFKNTVNSFIINSFLLNCPNRQRKTKDRLRDNLTVVNNWKRRPALLTYNARSRFINRPISTCKPSSFSGQGCQSAQMRREVRLKAMGVEVVNFTDRPNTSLLWSISHSIFHCLMTNNKKRATFFKIALCISRALRLNLTEGLFKPLPISPDFNRFFNLNIFSPLSNFSFVNSNLTYFKNLSTVILQGGLKCQNQK